jgi:hypothetical protein
MYLDEHFMTPLHGIREIRQMKTGAAIVPDLNG